jgi:hypothetical protein
VKNVKPEDVKRDEGIPLLTFHVFTFSRQNSEFGEEDRRFALALPTSAF